jgi:hypothetical protein
MSEYCEGWNFECRTVPEFDKVKLIIEHPNPGIGNCFCPMCGWLKWTYNCPYIPSYIKDHK